MLKKSTIFQKLLFCFFLLVASLCALASDVDVPNLNNVIEIDGKYSEAEWQNATQVDLAFITRPFEELPAPVKTTARVFENGTDLFVLFIAQDPNPDSVRSFMRDRDPNFGDDLVGIKLDTYNDGRLAYQFFVNPLGVQTDSIENEMTGSESASWNGIWESAGQLTNTGFVVEMKIPLRLMNFEESSNIKQWGIEFIRFYPRSDNYRLSHVPFDRNNSCNLCQMGKANGFVSAKQAQNLVFVPTLVVGSGRSRDPKQSIDWEYENNQEVGIDVNWGITPEVTLSGTLNPDFSQVESDVAQLNVNNTFALFFDERRPFFVENEDYFSSNQNLIYTRNINAPDYGAKVTGRVDQHSIGFFATNDESTRFVVPGNLGSSVALIEEESLNLATRYRYDYSDDVSVGLISTLRSSDSYENIVLGLDTRVRLTEQDTFRAQVVGSQTDYPAFLQDDFCDNDCVESEDFSETALRTADDNKFSGKSYILRFNRETDDYNINLRHTSTEADFRADLGFINTVDRTQSVIGGAYFWRETNSWWNQVRLRGDWDITHNDNGELIERELESYLSISGDYQTFIEIGGLLRDRVGLREDRSILAIDENTDLFTEESMSLYFETNPNPIVSYSVFTRIGDRIDFANNRLGEQIYLENEIELNLGRHARLELEHTRSQLDADNADLFVANLFDLRATYQFDTRQFIRLIATYSDVERNPDNYSFQVDEQSRDLGFQFLYSYKLNPLTKFFVGYSQNAFDDDDLTKLRVNNQSVFMKFSYAWLPQF